MSSTVYNPHIVLFEMPIFSLRVLRATGFLFMIALLLFAPPAVAADWGIPEAQLVAKITAATGPGAVALDVVNRSSLSGAEFEQVSRDLRAQLVADGLQFVNPDQAAATVRITLSEALRDYVWVAEIRQGSNESSVVMVSTPSQGALSTGSEHSAILMHRGLLWSQAQPILDVAVIDSGQTHMVVLDGERATLYRLQALRWQPEQILPISHAHPWPRDLRGRLVLRKDHLFDAY